MQYNCDAISDFNNKVKKAYGDQGRFNPDLNSEQKEEICLENEQVLAYLYNGSDCVEDSIT